MGEKQQITLKTLAEQCGLSVSTVSRILSGKGSQCRISTRSENAVLKKAAELGFRPNELARGLRLNRTSTLGLLIPDISNPFFASIARHVEIEARKSGYSIILCDSEEDTEIEIESLTLLRSRMVDGLIISPVGQIGKHLEEQHRDGMPVVVVDRYFPGQKIPYVASDNFKGALEGVSYLAAKGHRRIACIQGIKDVSSSKDRVKGYRATLKRYGIPADETLIVGDNFGESNGYIQTKLLLKRRQPPTAIFSTGNLISLGVIRAIREEGLAIPADISIVSFDDFAYSPFLATPITTLAQRTAEMGQIAVRLLLEQIRSGGKARPEGILLPVELIERQSVKRLS